LNFNGFFGKKVLVPSANELVTKVPTREMLCQRCLAECQKIEDEYPNKPTAILVAKEHTIYGGKCDRAEVCKN
jgi:hypothetical protein